MKRIAVFCGSSLGDDKNYVEQAYLLGKTLAAQDFELVYGGAKVGLMGAVANGILENKGYAIGIIPDFLQSAELAHENLKELIVVKSMHERKALMSNLSDGFITLPGGLGTLEEFFEMLTWAQLNLHYKPIAILNINGFYDGLISLIKQTIEKGFVQQVNLDLIIVSDNIDDLLEKMKNYKPTKIRKWKVQENNF